MLNLSSSRQDFSFQQLVDYVEKSARGDYLFEQNLGFGGISLEESFLANAELLKGARGKNTFIQRIFSLERVPGIAPERHSEALLDITQEFYDQYSENLMVWGKVHWEPHHIHIHLMESANEVGAGKRFDDHNKFEFNEINCAVERYFFEKYPDLATEPRFDKGLKAQYSLKTRTGLKSTIEAKMKLSTSKQDFLERLAELGITMYARGKHLGFQTKDGLKARAETLGLDLSAFPDLHPAQRAKEDRSLAQGRDAGLELSAPSGAFDPPDVPPNPSMPRNELHSPYTPKFDVFHEEEEPEYSSASDSRGNASRIFEPEFPLLDRRSKPKPMTWYFAVSDDGSYLWDRLDAMIIAHRPIIPTDANDALQLAQRMIGREMSRIGAPKKVCFPKTLFGDPAQNQTLTSSFQDAPFSIHLYTHPSRKMNEGMQAFCV